MKIKDMDTILQAIENRLHKIGWKFLVKPHNINNNCNKFQLEIIQNQAQDPDDKELIIVTRNSYDLSIIFPEKDSSDYSHKKFSHPDKMLDFIENYLLTR